MFSQMCSMYDLRKVQIGWKHSVHRATCLQFSLCCFCQYCCLLLCSCNNINNKRINIRISNNFKRLALASAQSSKTLEDFLSRWNETFRNITFLSHKIVQSCKFWQVQLAYMLDYSSGVVFIDRSDSHIRGSAVALDCCNGHSKINRKIEISALCRIVTPQISFWNLPRVIMSGTSAHMQILGQIRSARGSPQMREI